MTSGQYWSIMWCGMVETHAIYSCFSNFTLGEMKGSQKIWNNQGMIRQLYRPNFDLDKENTAGNIILKWVKPSSSCSKVVKYINGSPVKLKNYGVFLWTSHSSNRNSTFHFWQFCIPNKTPRSILITEEKKWNVKHTKSLLHLSAVHECVFACLTFSWALCLTCLSCFPVFWNTTRKSWLRHTRPRIRGVWHPPAFWSLS